MGTEMENIGIKVLREIEKQYPDLCNASDERIAAAAKIMETHADKISCAQTALDLAWQSLINAAVDSLRATEKGMDHENHP